MAWWNDAAYSKQLSSADLDVENSAGFPDYSDWQTDPCAGPLRRIGARNILGGLAAGKISAADMQKCSWVCRTSPLPGVNHWSRKCWEWLSNQAVCVPVFVPVVDRKQGRLIRFDCVVARANIIPAFLPTTDAEVRHRQSIQRARKALKRLEPDITSAYRVYADDGGLASRGDSASLGIALALWAGAMQAMNDQCPAMNALHGQFAVTGSLNPADGHVDAVGGLRPKAGACFRRILLAPYENREQDLHVQTVNNWEDAKARLAPSFVGAERGEFPACDVLIQFVSKQTEPLLNFAHHLKPRRAVILVHSDNKEYSKDPAERVEKCLDHNRKAWNGEDVPIIRRQLDSRRLHLAEQDLQEVFQEWTRQGIAEGRIVLNITCGNKLMTLAASNVARGRSCPVMYLELHEKEYSIIGWTRRNNPRPTRFIPESSDVLSGFDPQSVAECKGDHALRK